MNKEQFSAERRRLRNEFIKDEEWICEEIDEDGTSRQIISIRSHHYKYFVATLRKAHQSSVNEWDVVKSLWKKERKTIKNNSEVSEACRSDYIGKLQGKLGRAHFQEYSAEEQKELGLRAFERRQRESLYLQTGFAKNKKIYDLLQHAEQYPHVYFRIGPFQDAVICQTAQQLGEGTHCESLILRKDEMSVVEGLDVKLAALLLKRYCKTTLSCLTTELLSNALFGEESDFISRTAAYYLSNLQSDENYETLLRWGWRELRPRFIVGSYSEIKEGGKFVRAYLDGDPTPRPLSKCVEKVKRIDVVDRSGNLALPGTVVEVPYIDIRAELFRELIFTQSS